MTQRKTIVGVIHLLPLPGTPCSRHTFQQVLERAKLDAKALKEGGVHMAILENFGDAPFVRGSVEPHIVSMMTVIALKLKVVWSCINVLRNDARSAIYCIAWGQNCPVNVHTGGLIDQG